MILALGNAACRQGFRTRYYRVPRLLGFVEPKNLIAETTVKKALGEFQDDLGG